MTLSVALGPDTQEGTRTGTEAFTDSLTAPDIPWNLVIWNDPVNLMSYVSYVFQSYFGYSESKANKLMMEVHKKGRSIVAHGSKEQVERHAVAMHGFGLWATVEKASGGNGGSSRNSGKSGGSGQGKGKRG
ncbi:ATP-dependent Clp protease adapter ClpS [Pseudarthrobacter psychrotolerans]|uniref:ATP-dependent Clp protease adapter protein ClpS n=1 Tax=Pseudarthrobacter psychrotolerans TaxID=2697569 RepID=A0A6P1NIV9_9MICC|nr:ATP-dependent Clp protease adapter ClpS [Pseudarthrobacter psychrotolerans]QHK19519.1 ATP-dependent Clp protease adapter ClpS [Pseudarthrobacter psychrotolerans]